MAEYSYDLHQDDVPAGIDWGSSVAVDTETTGLKFHRDRLCLVQISRGDGHTYLIEIAQNPKPAPNLCRLLQDEQVVKLFHFARFDVAMLLKTYGVVTSPIYCTKIASKLARTNTDSHGLRDLCRDLIGVQLEKSATHSDWASTQKTPEQLGYACDDVLHLHKLQQILNNMLAREDRAAIAKACMEFLPVRAECDIMGFEDTDIFAHR